MKLHYVMQVKNKYKVEFHCVAFIFNPFQTSSQKDLAGNEAKLPKNKKKLTCTSKKMFEF